jgi:hypothetical protein
MPTIRRHLVQLLQLQLLGEATPVFPRSLPCHWSGPWLFDRNQSRKRGVEQNGKRARASVSNDVRISAVYPSAEKDKAVDHAYCLGGDIRL